MVYNNSINAGVTGYVKANGSGSFSGITDIPVADGGTGNNTFTAYSIIAAGTTATGPFQNISGLGTSGQILTSNGAGALPSWQNAPAGTGVDTLTGNTGGAISPLSGNIDTVGTGSITIAGTTNTLTTQLTGLTNHNVLVGAGTPTIGLIAPSATSGVPLVSAGASADPAFGTAVVAGGGTGTTTFTAYSVIAAGTTATGPFQNVSGVGTTGQILTSNGAGALPSWQNAPTGSGVNTLTGNTGGAISPTSGNINTVGTGSITIAGAGSTLTTQLTGLTDHNVLLGAGTATVGLAAPSATAGIPLVSAGASADPSFTTAVVAGGGTGNTTFTAYSVICAGTTATGAFQNVSGVGTTGQVLTSAGAGALPTWSTPAAGGFTSVNIQTLTASGTYTPTSGMKYCIVELVGGGGGGGGSSDTGGATLSAGGGGGGGGYSRKVVSAATVGASQSVTIGAGGTAGTANSGGSGGTGGTTSFGSIFSVDGGIGGSNGPAGGSVSVGGGAGGGASGTGDFNCTGASGTFSYGTVVGSFLFSGAGGDSIFGQGASAISGGASTVVGGTGILYGGGGSGAYTWLSLSGSDGGPGASGLCVVTEFIS